MSQCHFKLNDQALFGQTFDLDEDALLVAVENKPRVSAKEIAKVLKFDI